MNSVSPLLADVPLGDLIGYQLRRLSLLTMADLTAALEPLDLRPTECSILLVMLARPGVTQSELGRLLGVQRANMAPLVAGLETRGLLGRERMDGRSHALRLTEKGEALAEQATIAARESDRRCFAELGEGERRQLAIRLRDLLLASERPD